MIDQQQQINSPQSLPIVKYRQQILQAIRANAVTIICGDTGSGKTTQVPKFMYPFFKKIIISQPRRISAITLAERVAEEMKVVIGEQVGYNVRFQEKRSRQTRIVFATDGMAIRQMMSGISYDLFILDEAHERSINTDVLMAILHKRLSNSNTKRQRPFKLIIMSATIDSSKFMRYFNTDSLINIEGRSFPTQVFNLVEPVQSYLEAAFNSILQIHYQEAPGDILCFLTGQDQIITLHRRIEKAAQQYSLKLEVLMLYSALPHEYQHRVFQKDKNSPLRRVILSTNIAETSVTIPGVKYVVDSGFMKVRVFDNQRFFDMLSVVPVSKANALQRAGRAGREDQGKCFRLYLKNSYDELPTQNVPEILRSELSGPVLQLKAIGIPQIKSLSFMDQPKDEVINECLNLLRQLKCITPQPQQQITNYGKDVSKIPLPPRLAHLLLLSLDYKCQGIMLSLMAILSIDNLFLSSAVGDKGNRKTGLYQVLMRYQPATKSSVPVQQYQKQAARAFYSDHLAKVNILQEYIDAKNKVIFCKQNFVNKNNIKRAILVRDQLAQYLQQIIAERKKKDFFKLQTKQMAKSAFKERVVFSQQSIKQWLSCMSKGCQYGTAKLNKDGKYNIFGTGQVAQIHPQSICFYMNSKPPAIIFSSVVRTNKVYLKDVSVLPDI